MSGGDRYRQTGRRRQYGGVTCFEGVDSLTRRPVVIYEFEGQPVAGADSLSSPYICRVVHASAEGERGRVVTEMPSGWRRWTRSRGPLTPVEALGTVRAVRDAAAAGVRHGAISHAYLVLASDRALLSGYGVPWPDDSDDVRALAATLLETGVAAQDDTLPFLLEQCLTDEDASRPTAEELALALESLYPEAAAELDSMPAPAYPPAEPPLEPRALAVADDPADEDDLRRLEQQAQRRRVGLLASLFLSIVVLALLALYGPRAGSEALRAGQESTIFVIEVRVEPEDLPPVSIHLVSSPEGSELQRGRVLGTAPRHLALDRPGTWAFQGVLQDSRSEVVEVVVPEERSVTLRMPADSP